MPRTLRTIITILALAVSAPSPAQTIQNPESFFGFRIGTDGEMARYPKILEYLQHVASNSDRVLYEELGKTTEGNPYVLLKVSSPENLARLDRLVEINRRLADPRGLAESEALELAREGRPFYFLYATIHSTEVGNGQAVPLIVHRLATEDSEEILEILDNTVLLYVPSQNPDGQVMVIDHWYETKGTSYNRVFPDLYHKYVGHDDNRDWFMFTQVETRLNVEKVQNVYRPTITHDMHQMGPMGARIFVPPFKDPYDPNIHPLLVEGQAQVGLAMAGALIASGKDGVTYETQYDLWTPARQYMVYHGQPRILTEIASANIADPFVSASGSPLGPQETRWNYPRPYQGSEWRLSQIIDYGMTAVLAGLEHLAKYRTTWLENFYRVHRDWVERSEPPFAFVIPKEQRDPYETLGLLRILELGDVEIHQADGAFNSGGEDYAAGSWVIRLDQPYGAFAKTMLEIQEYPDLRYYPGGPPIPPYDVTAHTLGYLMGVDVDRIDEPLDTELTRVENVTPAPHSMPPNPGWAYVIPPESNAGFLALNRLTRAGVAVFRAGEPVTTSEESIPPGAWLVRPGRKARAELESVSRETGLRILSAERAARVQGYRMRQPTRIGLFKVANNMPAGWLMWLLERYEFDHAVMSSTDFETDLSEKYDVILLPSGTTKERMVEGLSAARHDEKWRWAFGIGEEGWSKLRAFVENGGTLVAIGSAVANARELFDLPIEPLLPSSRRRFSRAPDRRDRSPDLSARDVDRLFREAFESPARLASAIEERVVDPTSVFYCPGSLLEHEYDNRHPVAFGMPERWPLFFRRDQAYRLKPSFEIRTDVVSKYPDEDDLVASGWLLGGELLRDQASVVAFEVGRGTVVTARKPGRLSRPDSRDLQARVQCARSGTGRGAGARRAFLAGCGDARREPGRLSADDTLSRAEPSASAAGVGPRGIDGRARRRARAN